MANTLFKQALLAKRKAMKPAVRARTRKPKKRLWLYPWARERYYATQLASWLDPLIKDVEKYFSEQGEAILHGDEYKPMTVDHPRETTILDGKEIILHEAHTDTLPGPGFVLLSKTLAGWVAQYYPDPSTNRSPSGLMMGLGATSAGVKSFADKQWGKQTEPVLGFQFNTAETWWPGLKQQWEDTNYSLIKSVATKYIDRVNTLAEQAVTNGWSYQTLMKDIKAEGWKLKGYQVRRLARDQIGKLNGQISQAQQEDAGINMYLWDTAGDERVRGRPGGHFPGAVPSHWVMQGKLCRWNDATVYSKDGGKTWIPREWNMPKAHPGQEIQCRCTSIPYFDDIIEEVDQQLKNNNQPISPIAMGRR